MVYKIIYKVIKRFRTTEDYERLQMLLEDNTDDIDLYYEFSEGDKEYSLGIRKVNLYFRNLRYLFQIRSEDDIYDLYSFNCISISIEADISYVNQDVYNTKIDTEIVSLSGLDDELFKRICENHLFFRHLSISDAVYGEFSEWLYHKFKDTDEILSLPTLEELLESGILSKYTDLKFKVSYTVHDGSTTVFSIFTDYYNEYEPYIKELYIYYNDFNTFEHFFNLLYSYCEDIGHKLLTKCIINITKRHSLTEDGKRLLSFTVPSCILNYEIEYIDSDYTMFM